MIQVWFSSVKLVQQDSVVKQYY